MLICKCVDELLRTVNGKSNNIMVTKEIKMANEKKIT